MARNNEMLQLSFEFMIYLGIAISSLMIGVSAFIHFHVSLSNLSEKISLEEFATLINENIGQKTSLHVFIPQSLCGAGSENAIIQLNSLIIANNISINKSICRNSGAIKNITIISLQNGSIGIE